MEIECLGCANWSKVSEIALNALLSGIVAAFTVIAAYWFGMKQSNRHWEREVKQREKEQNDQERIALYQRRIDSLTRITDKLSRFLPLLTVSNDLITVNETKFYPSEIELKLEIQGSLPLFPFDHEPTTNSIMIAFLNYSSEILPIFKSAPGGYIQDFDEEYTEVLDYHLFSNYTYDVLQERIEELVKRFG